ncbi:MAG: hypothetical protein C7B44_06150 [Sulfobacillus thermosulfidooxidans]|nr:MAG: hypothetical protein C7B44_06150 [Sulfobacillus thermosulfidooxidans]
MTAFGQPSLHLTATQTSSPWIDHLIQKTVNLVSDSATLNRLKRCKNPQCVLVFIDRSKNHNRRWCDMNTCGNRLKASRHYQRHHAIG